MSTIPLLLSTFLLALSLYAANLSILAITRLQSWESTTEAAATVSTAAATQLRRTRSTQGVAAGAVRVLRSYLAFLAPLASHPSDLPFPLSRLPRYISITGIEPIQTLC